MNTVYKIESKREFITVSDTYKSSKRIEKKIFIKKQINSNRKDISFESLVWKIYLKEYFYQIKILSNGLNFSLILNQNNHGLDLINGERWLNYLEVV